jgi:hypothetical protein
VGDRKASLALVTAERSWLLLADPVLDALRSKCTLAERIALSERVGALPTAREVEITVVEVGVAIFEV